MSSSQNEQRFEALDAAVLVELEALERALDHAQSAQCSAIESLPAATRAAGRNLVHYVALRQLDIRPLQHQLTGLGLSSLGRAEIAVEDALRRTANMLRRVLSRPVRALPEQDADAGYAELAERTQRLLGTADAPAIMVTMPSEAAHDAEVIRGLLEAGMNVMRVNCAHDTDADWRAMVVHLRQAEREQARSCKVLFDLPGPKLRTGGIEPGPRVLHLRPERDEYGRPLRPATLHLREWEGEVRGEPAPDEVWMPAGSLVGVVAGDTIELRDLREKRRALVVTRREASGVECQTNRGVYLGEETRLHVHTRAGRRGAVSPLRIRAREQPLRLKAGDALLLLADDGLGRPARLADTERGAEPAAIGCGVPDAVRALHVGHSVLFDDGKISTQVEALSEQGALLRIRRTRLGGAKLRAEKGINLPDTDLSRLTSLSSADLAALDLAAELADMVGLSFTRDARDVAALQRLLAERKLERLGVVLKVETRAGFEALAPILFEALKRPNVGVMIARGDLAVECGFERLAELQEEMLWLCEAARVPAIWATQVLEELAKKGQPSRAEITDAAMAERAECVMLNKGPYVRDAVRSLRDVVDRMRGHQQKKRSMLRPLRSVRLTPPA